MAVESLAIVGGPLAGLMLNGSDPLANIGDTLRNVGIRPMWLLYGAVGGLIFHEASLAGMFKGALMGGAISMVCYYSNR
jgi:hypothetical protein